MECREYLYLRRNRCVGRLLGELEDVVPEEIMGQVRRIVKTRISEYHTDVLDAIDGAASVQFNAIAMKVRDQVGSQGTH
jgi:hypothetical protein